MPVHPDIDSAILAAVPAVRELRHALHRIPELACAEHDTAALLRRELGNTALRLLPPFLGTDIVGLLQGRGPGRNVTLRADMDALPLQELTGLPYASTRPGCMHACGHDGHSAMLVGAARVLSGLCREFDGSVRFVFQPGEEIVGAGRDLVAKGALLDPVPDAVLALHGWASMPLGVIGSRPGVFMAACDFFKITVQGKGGHGSKPADAIDPIVIGAQIVNALQAIVSRQIDALQPVVVSVCRFTGGTNANIIPATVELEGTVRYLDAAVGAGIAGRIERVVRGVCESAGATYDWDYVRPYIPTVNDPAVVELGRRVATTRLGPDRWLDVAEPSMGAEDFAYYIREYPGAMFRLGLGRETPLHNPHFDFNDDVLAAGITFLVHAALESLGSAG